MSYELSTNVRRGFALAHSHAVYDEATKTRAGMMPLSEQGWSHEQRVARVQWLLAMTQEEDEAATWAAISYYGAAFSGAQTASDELRVETGDEDRACRGCGMAFGAIHRKDCPYAHPWPRDRVDNVQTQITPV